MRSWCSQPQSAPGLVFANCIQLLHFQVQRMQSTWFWYWPFGDLQMLSHLLCCWKRVFAMTNAFSWQNSVSPCPASFCSPGPNLPVTPGISWPPTFAFQSPVMKSISFVGVSSRRSCRSSQNHSTSASLALVVGAQTWITVILNCLGNKQRSFCHFWNCTQVLGFRLLSWLWEL